MPVNWWRRGLETIAGIEVAAKYLQNPRSFDILLNRIKN